jgi:hypothetical protein
VRRTGIALVHEGELVLPAAGSAAEAEQVVDDARATVQYVFPVEIEVRGAPAGPDLDELAELTLSKLARGLEGLSGLESA